MESQNADRMSPASRPADRTEQRSNLLVAERAKFICARHATHARTDVDAPKTSFASHPPRSIKLIFKSNQKRVLFLSCDVRRNMKKARAQLRGGTGANQQFVAVAICCWPSGHKGNPIQARALLTTRCKFDKNHHHLYCSHHIDFVRVREW